MQSFVQRVSCTISCMAYLKHSIPQWTKLWHTWSTISLSALNYGIRTWSTLSLSALNYGIRTWSTLSLRASAYSSIHTLWIGQCKVLSNAFPAPFHAINNWLVYPLICPLPPPLSTSTSPLNALQAISTAAPCKASLSDSLDEILYLLLQASPISIYYSWSL